MPRPDLPEERQIPKKEVNQKLRGLRGKGRPLSGGQRSAEPEHGAGPPEIELAKELEACTRVLAATAPGTTKDRPAMSRMADRRMRHAIGQEARRKPSARSRAAARYRPHRFTRDPHGLPATRSGRFRKQPAARAFDADAALWSAVIRALQKAVHAPAILG